MKKIIKINNDTIRKGHCTTRNVRIHLKDFEHFLVCDAMAFYSEEYKVSEDGMGKFKEYGTSLTEDKILYFYNIAESVEVTGKELIIETEHYKIYVELRGE